MKATELIRALVNAGEAEVARPGDFDNIEVKGLAYDSRAVKEGYAFVVYKGFKDSAYLYIDSAIKSGAKLLILEGKDIELSGKGISFVFVKDGRKSLAILAKKFYDNPSSKLKTIGITGTYGKTTTTWLLRSIYESAGLSTGLFGTVKYYVGDKELDAHHTTPESLELHSMFADLLVRGVKVCVMEVSSHSLELSRVYGIDFDIAGFTVLERDHLDFHETVEKYASAKQKLFSGLKEGSFAVLNKDSYVFEDYSSSTRAKVISYGIGADCNVTGEILKADLRGIDIKLNWKFPKGHCRAKVAKGEDIIHSPLVGPHNLSNIILSSAIGLSDGLVIEVIKEGIGAMKLVPGRFEVIGRIIIDYAHTPGAMEAALKSARAITPGRLICVFGCGGDRDRGKRSLMGGIASENSDYVILTTDNPRTEDPENILQDIVKGIKKSNYEIINDRETAIRHAVERSSEEDVIMLIGKGHEGYQIFGEIKVSWDERGVAEEAIKKYGNSKH